MDDDLVNKKDSGDDSICRDFLRNVCKRGKRCKYRHPEAKEAEELGKKGESYVFCHDYQNRECRRDNCKFIHCTRAEEDNYHLTGELPPTVLENLQRRTGTAHVTSSRVSTQSDQWGSSSRDNYSNDNDIPICKDFLKGDCFRGGRCKFRHLTQSDSYGRESGSWSGPPRPTNIAAQIGAPSGSLYDAHLDDRRAYGQVSESAAGMVHAVDGGWGAGMTDRRNGLSGQALGAGLSANLGAQARLYDDPYSAQRAAAAASTYDDYEPERKRRFYDLDVAERGALLSGRPAILSEYRMLEEENALLRRRVEELKKQVADLNATNEFLLNQNAQLRLGKSAAGGVAAVSQSLGSAASAANVAAALAVPLNDNSAAALAGTTSVTALAAPQPGAQAATATITVPVSLAAQGSLTSVSMAGPVSLAPSIPAASLSQNLALTMSGPSTPLVSYPIMTSQMRPAALPQSSLAR